MKLNFYCIHCCNKNLVYLPNNKHLPLKPRFRSSSRVCILIQEVFVDTQRLFVLGCLLVCLWSQNHSQNQTPLIIRFTPTRLHCEWFVSNVCFAKWSEAIMPTSVLYYTIFSTVSSRGTLIPLFKRQLSSAASHNNPRPLSQQGENDQEIKGAANRI